MWFFTEENLVRMAGILHAAENIMSHLKKPFKFEIRINNGVYELLMYDLSEYDIPLKELSKDIDVDEGI